MPPPAVRLRLLPAHTGLLDDIEIEGSGRIVIVILFVDEQAFVSETVTVYKPPFSELLLLMEGF